MIIPIKNELFDDRDITLDVVKVGQEHCSPRKPVEGCVRPCYSLHFVMFGRGTIVSSDGYRYNVNKNEVFLLYEGEQYRYYPNSTDPWSYIWVEFTGENLDKLISACGFEKNNIKKHVKDFSCYLELMRSLYDAYDAGEAQQLKCGAYLLLVISKLIEYEQDGKVPPKIALKRKQMREILIYINNNIAANLTNQMIAQVNGISVSSLNMLFNDILGMPPVDYINAYRIATACERFQTTNLNVKDAAFLVGFTDEKYFTRVFTNIKGVSPQEYKKSGTLEDPFLWIKEKGMLFR